MNVFDRKYCIVDNTGNYYRINEYDTLEVASGEDTAEWFDILEANKRINNSGMGKILRTVAVTKKPVKKKKAAKLLQIEMENGFTMEEIDLAALAEKLRYVQQNICQYQKKLKEQQTSVDEELCDIVHFIELYEHDDAQSLELVNRIQECRKKRRLIKDQSYKAEIFSGIFKTGGMENVLKNINHQMENMEIREYIPRQLPGLFVGAVKQTEQSMENLEVMCEQGNCNDDYVEEAMDYERNETIFDGARTDWGAIVTQQKEFFDNIEQYSTNLQIDLEELDMQIENLMIQCEEANCNVAQGYKMFKHLKELRLLRKEKLSELNKVSSIADCFDCRAMADKYRYCEDAIMEKELVQDVNITNDIEEAV